MPAKRDSDGRVIDEPTRLTWRSGGDDAAGDGRRGLDRAATDRYPPPGGFRGSEADDAGGRVVRWRSTHGSHHKDAPGATAR